MTDNPLIQPFDCVPFSQINQNHYLPAFEHLIGKAKFALHQIATQKTPPTFDNTLGALEYSAQELERASLLFFNLLSANTNEQLQALAQTISPLLSAFSNDVLLNQELYARIATIHQQRDQISLLPEQKRLLDQQYRAFLRNGAQLNPKDKATLRSIDQTLAQTTLTFGNNVLADTNAYYLHLHQREDLNGLTTAYIESAQEKAKAKGKAGFLIGLDFPSYMPFMKYAKNRAHRKTLWQAFGSRGFLNNDQNNEDIIKRIVRLRKERALLLGYKSHAHFVLEERMAKSPQAVRQFLEEFGEKAGPAAQKELEELKAFALEQEGIDQLEPWDTAYFSEQLKKKLFDWDEEAVKPYFPLHQVLEGAFAVTHKLYGMVFQEDSSIEVYHPEVKAFRVMDHNGTLKAILYTDFHPRPSKRDGAWMTSYKNQYCHQGTNERPHISIVCNFTPPTATTPSLLSFQEVTTLFHEFGHALHGILADTIYPSLSGTHVSWDFVELPSQIMENWCYQDESLALFAKHYQTGAALPEHYLTQIKQIMTFQQGMQTLRQIGFASLDMAYHDESGLEKTSVKAFEKQALRPTQLFDPSEDTCMSTAFSHIFQGGYAAGYYSYKWAEVLDADAFGLFQERGIFDQATAQAFKNNILSQGGTQDPMDLFVAFRGRQPSPDALLKRSGLV